MNEREKDYWERRFDELFPNGLTQEQTDEANREMWKEQAVDDNQFYCGKCKRFISITEYPHDC